MERMKCPECGSENPMTGVSDEARKYVCRQCGMVYYTPDNCLKRPQEDPPGPESDEPPR